MRYFEIIDDCGWRHSLAIADNIVPELMPHARKSKEITQEDYEKDVMRNACCSKCDQYRAKCRDCRTEDQGLQCTKGADTVDLIKCYEWMIHNFGFTKEMGLYALIYSYHQRGEVCDLSKNQMAAYLGCSYAQIVRCVCALRDGGFITVTERGAPQTTLYQIDADAAETLKAIYRTARGGELNG